MEINKLLDLPIKDILSYSRIDVFKTCKYRYKLQYIEKHYSDTTSLALELGTLCHKCMELKYMYKGNKMDKILNIFSKGYKDDKENILGLEELIDKYGFEYYDINEKSGMSVEDKVNIFLNKLKNENIDSEWKTIGLEVPFVIIFENKAKIRGFIDRVDQNIHTKAIRVVDYKTNNMPYDKKDLATPLQMYIYSLACKELYGQYPEECIYDMLFHDTQQIGGTKGYMDRGFKALNKILDSMIYYQDLGNEHLEPKPSPLCHFCSYCETNPNADEWDKTLCEYYCKWTRANRTFEVNKKWQPPIIENGGEDEELEGWD